MITADSIIDKITEWIKEGQYISPAVMLDSAMKVNQLCTDLDNNIALLEAQMNEIEAEYIKQDMPASKAKVLARSEIEYKKYLELKAKFKRIDEWCKLAKKRSTIEDL